MKQRRQGKTKDSLTTRLNREELAIEAHRAAVSYITGGNDSRPAARVVREPRPRGFYYASGARARCLVSWDVFSIRPFWFSHSGPRDRPAFFSPTQESEKCLK